MAQVPSTSLGFTSLPAGSSWVYRDVSFSIYPDGGLFQLRLHELYSWVLFSLGEGDDSPCFTGVQQFNEGSCDPQAGTEKAVSA